MCLDIVDEKTRKPRNGIAYKAVDKTDVDGQYKPICNGNQRFRIGVRITDTNPHLLGFSRTYKPGFHCSGSFREARKWEPEAILKVKCEDIAASGRQFDGKVYVARTITPLEVIE